MLQLQCNLDRQDCASLYPPLSGYTYFRIRSFSDQSCIRDTRLQGTVGRCGFTGAPCDVVAGVSTCAFQAPQICNNMTGICMGGPGQPCTSDDDCNFGIYCNSTRSGTCGGAGAIIHPDNIDGQVDFGRDYCASGLANQTAPGNWTCTSGPFLIVPSPTPSHRKSRVPLGAIIGPVIAAVVILALVVAFILHRRRKRRIAAAAAAALESERVASEKGGAGNPMGSPSPHPPSPYGSSPSYPSGPSVYSAYRGMPEL